MSQPTLTREQFHQEADKMTKTIVEAISGEHAPFVVLEALLRAHQFVTQQLPTEVTLHIAMSLAAYARNLASTSQAASGGGPVH